MKVIKVIFLVWLTFMIGINLATCSYAGEASFSWLPNSETDLAGYMIYYGPSPGEYTGIQDCGLPDTVKGRVACTIPTVPDVATYYAATAYDKADQSSDYSNELVYDPPPSAVQGITTITVVVNVSMSQ